MESIAKSQNCDRSLNKAVVTGFLYFFLLCLKNKTKEYFKSNQIQHYESNLKFENELLNIQEVKEVVLVIKKIKY